ncbi:MAG TPA: UDP-N-acetylmuramoyl-L-alanyl-D-glutamate--2,6-diaminopimelate ligase, partial [Clostridiales bacterium]|nr:UDP-N-acetylmuramoyl-L-alanyl-D-glutamate--2,6-diaminopimelate ligase [Clostridiales bacterium]
MKLENLLYGVEIQKTNADLNAEIKEIKIDSRKVEDGDLFVCLEGVNDDGNNHLCEIDCDFIALTQKEPESGKYVLVTDARKAYAQVCQNRFLRPMEGMKFIAVVGTNGKTSTAHYIDSVLTFAGVKTGLIGTEGHYILGEKVGQSLTTPDPYELNELFFKMRTRGVEVVIAEVSAHAIYLEKLGDLKADVAILTNVSQDHLDYFKDFSNYQSVKMSYFENGNAKTAIVNVDDESGRILLSRLEGRKDIKTLSYG